MARRLQINIHFLGFSQYSLLQAYPEVRLIVSGEVYILGTFKNNQFMMVSFLWTQGHFFRCMKHAPKENWDVCLSGPDLAEAKCYVLSGCIRQ